MKKKNSFFYVIDQKLDKIYLDFCKYITTHYKNLCKYFKNISIYIFLKNKYLYYKNIFISSNFWIKIKPHYEIFEKNFHKAMDDMDDHFEKQKKQLYAQTKEQYKAFFNELIDHIWIAALIWLIMNMFLLFVLPVDNTKSFLPPMRSPFSRQWTTLFFDKPFREPLINLKLKYSVDFVPMILHLQVPENATNVIFY